MTEKKQIYRCNVCGNIVEVVHEGIGELVCCGEPMELLEPSKEDKGHEKHVPVIEKTSKGVKVKVGSNPHPMEKEHYIEWIQIMMEEGTCRKHLKPGQEPEAEFQVDKEDIKTAREYCNVHGLWKTPE